MISKQGLDRLLTISHDSANSALGNECDEMRKDTIGLVAKQVDAKVLFVSLENTWTSAMENGPIAVGEHMQLLRLAINFHQKPVIIKNSETLGGLFIQAFDLRRIQCSPRTEDSYADSEINDVETAFNETAMAMVYKINDASFRPIFSEACSWAFEALPETSITGKIYRKTTWYTFLLHFFGNLKASL